MTLDGMVDISCELEKIELLAAHLAQELFSLQSYKDDRQEEKHTIKTMYWIADTLRTTAIQAHAELYPKPPLKLAP